MKIYTKTGDQGMTGLYGGDRVRKDDHRIESYGTIDELNSFIGWINARGLDYVDSDFFQKIQSQLFNIGSHLATSADSDMPLPDISDGLTRLLEEGIDRMNEDLPKLKSFVLPGGTEINAMIHIARTVCRRAERRVVGFSQHEKIHPEIVIFLNRLSDYLFVLARYASWKEGKEEVPWIGV